MIRIELCEINQYWQQLTRWVKSRRVILGHDAGQAKPS